MRRAIDAIDASAEFEAGPESAIRDVIFGLIAVTARPPSIDDAKEVAYQEALCEALWDYPIDVVTLACKNWRRIPERGRWWPTEQDLRAECDKLVQPRKEFREEALSVLRFLERKESQQGSAKSARASYPYGATLAYLNDCMASHGPGFCRSYLSHRTCDFTEDTVFTIGMAVERLQQRTSAIAAKHGIRFMYCPEVTARFYADEDRRAGVDAETPKRKSYQRRRYEDG